MLIRCAVIDDDIRFLELIKTVFLTISFQIECDFNNKYYQDPSELNLENQFDLFILDVEIPSLNGFELAEKIITADPEALICFCSGHEELVFQSFHFNDFFFIRKSHLHDDLLSAIQKYRRIIQIDNKTLHAMMNGTEHIIHLKEIVYVDCNRNNIQIHTKSGDVFDIRKTMKQMRHELDSLPFIPVGNSSIVNCNAITAFDHNSLCLSNDIKIKIPRRKLSEIRKKILTFKMMKNL